MVPTSSSAEIRKAVAVPVSKGTIKKVAGPLVIAKGMRDANMFDVVRVSNQRLIGEILSLIHI